MKGDFTRFTFDPTKLYSSVLLQQGRVLLDAEWNEQVDIERHTGAHHRCRRDRPLRHARSPRRYTRKLRDRRIRLGIHDSARAHLRRRNPRGKPCRRARVGERAALPARECPTYSRRHAAAAGQPLPAAAGRYLAYLDVWQRHVTTLEDGNLREVALGGPDSATRMQTVWQVFLQELAAGASCSNLGGGWPPAHAKTTGKLAARARPTVDPTNACQVPGGGGYSRLENQLYRVEVETSGELATAKFKWSRDNGMVVSAVTDGDTDTLTVDNPGRDDALAFAGDQYVELLNEDRELLNQPGLLLEVDDVKGDVLSSRPAASRWAISPAGGGCGAGTARGLSPRRRTTTAS